MGQYSMNEYFELLSNTTQKFKKIATCNLKQKWSYLVYVCTMHDYINLCLFHAWNELKSKSIIIHMLKILDIPVHADMINYNDEI